MPQDQDLVFRIEDNGAAAFSPQVVFCLESLLQPAEHSSAAQGGCGNLVSCPTALPRCGQLPMPSSCQNTEASAHPARRPRPPTQKVLD